MKKVFLGFSVVLCITLSIWAFVRKSSMEMISTIPTQIEFEKTEIDMGELKLNKPKTVRFHCKNVGEYPLLIQHIETSCGCTQPNWPKHPIKPKDSAEIKVTYDAKYPGRFLKTITVFCNTEKGMVKLKIKGEVKLSDSDK